MNLLDAVGVYLGIGLLCVCAWNLRVFAIERPILRRSVRLPLHIRRCVQVAFLWPLLLLGIGDD
jgi:hypothetical protein